MGIFKLFRKKGENDGGETISPDDLWLQGDFCTDMMRSAEAFVSRSSDRFSGLDYSVESLQVIDTLLEEASLFYHMMNQSERNKIVREVGAYVFEVARTNYGGCYFWHNELRQPVLVTGQNGSELSVFAFDKVKSRLIYGMDCSIPYYFKDFAERCVCKEAVLIG